jgi:hypothetical protein
MGSLVRVNYGTVQNCSFTGNVTYSYSYRVGGLVGENYGIVQNCFFNGNVNGNFNNSSNYILVGGVVGFNQKNGIVENCYSIGNINYNSYYSEYRNYNGVGGVVGANGTNGKVQNCYFIGNVNVTGTGPGTSAGGVVGMNQNGIVQNCYSSGNISSLSGSGGVVGLNGPDVGGGLSTVQNCVALNSSMTGTYSGRITGRHIHYITINNYARSDMQIEADVTSDANGIHGADITSAQWNSASWWQNTALFPSSAWEFRAGLPILRNMPPGTQNPMVQN